MHHILLVFFICTRMNFGNNINSVSLIANSGELCTQCSYGAQLHNMTRNHLLFIMPRWAEPRGIR